jgi:mannose-6-phosphate isomerase-like protein (cupin superfamily)
MNTQGKVWGLTQHIFAHNDVSIHRVEIIPGGTCSKHLHEHKWNAFWIEQGELQVEVWKNTYDLVDVTLVKAGQITQVPPGEYHRFINRSSETCIAYEIYWTQLNENDIKREGVGGIDLIRDLSSR